MPAGTADSYGEGTRAPIHYTRPMVNAVLNEELDDVAYREDPIF